MKKNPFDSIIKGKLEDFKADQLPSDWNAFEEKLSMAQGEPATPAEKEFDQVIFSKMNEFQASGWFKDQHSRLLEKQMYFLAGIRQRLLQYKLIEVLALTLLLLYVVEADAPGSRYLPHGASPAIQAEQQPSKVEANPLIAQNSTQEDYPSSESVTIQPLEEAVILQASPDYTDLKQTENQNTSSRHIDHISLATLASENTKVVVANTAESVPTEPHLSDNQAIALNTLPTQTALLNYVYDLNLGNNLRQKKAIDVQVSMLGGADYNRVMTPENLSKGIKAFERYSAGYRGGLMADFGRQDSRIRIGSGFIYTAKQYGVSYTRINGSLLRGSISAESLKDIELNIVNVPVFARYNFWNSQRWSLFAHGGMAMQVALQANYYVGYPSNLPQPIGINQTPSRYSQITDRTGGLFEGGNFKENSYLTSHLGLGAERRMTTRWSLFLQSRYEHSIGYLSSGLGPTQDRINTFSFESGVRVKLK